LGRLEFELVKETVGKSGVFIRYEKIFLIRLGCGIRILCRLCVTSLKLYHFTDYKGKTH
jgi:hypothetical protein